MTSKFSNQNQQLDKINDTLSRIAVYLKKVSDSLDVFVEQTMAPKEPEVPIMTDDSMGSCPQCENTKVHQVGEYPNSIYQCQSCEVMWVNHENKFFST